MTSRPPVSPVHAWTGALVVGAAMIGSYFALPGGLAQSLGYNVIGLASVAAILVGIRLHRPADKTTWVLFALGNLGSTLADGVSTVYTSLDLDLPMPSIADALYLASYPFLFAAVWRLGRRLSRSGARERRIDAVIVSLGALALSWHLLIGAYAHDNTVSLIGKFTLAAYPVMDVGVLFIVVSTLLFGGARDAVDKLIGLAMGIMLIGDFAFDLLELHGSYASGDLVDVTWLSNYVLVGVAALHPSMARVRVGGDGVAPDRRAWMPIVAIAGFVAPVLLLVGSINGADADVPVLAGTSIVMGVLVTVRMSWMFGSMRNQTMQLLSRSESLQEALLARDSLAADLRHQAFHDSLTGLANRSLLHDRVEHALARLARASDTVALILFDLDGFKTVNDSLGHQSGDALLVTVAARMSSVVRPGDTVARLGGDEFAVFMEGVGEPAETLHVVDRILAVLREPALIGDRSIALSASAGVAFGTAMKTTEQLLSEADAAMYEAKSHGRNRHEVFESSMRSRVLERLEFTNAFAGALERSEFYVDFQPLFTLEDGRLQGFEALVRWDHPVLGLVSPLRFIPLAEETGFIVPLGRRVLNIACRAAMSWSGGADTPPTVAVNLSARQLQDPDLLSDVRSALVQSGLPGDRLVLEVTEGMLVGDPEKTVDILNHLKQMGIRIAIDDFGTGYSSLSHLRRYPVDILKIDKSFVDQLDGSHREGPAFIEAIIRLARDLQVATVAEGIEDGIQRDVLTDMGCDVGQGFLLSRPLGMHAAAELARRAAAAGATVAHLADCDPDDLIGVGVPEQPYYV